MANTYPSFLVDNQDDKLSAPEQGPVQPLTNFFEQTFEEDQRKTAVAARWAKQYDPQAYAEAAKLAPDLPPEVGVRQLTTLRDTAKLEAYKEVLARAPALQEYFVQKPKDLAYAQPDELDNISGLSWAAQAGWGSVQQSWEASQMYALGRDIVAGKATDEQTRFFEAWNTN